MTAPVLLTGGTGTLGRPVLALLRHAQRPVRVLSRQPHEPADGVEYAIGDVSTGAGLDAAMTGVETIIHCAGSAKGDAEKARHLTQAAARAGVRHLVFVSVVGADRVPVISGLDRAMFGYFAEKREAERIVAGSGVPWTTLRATQFHEWVLDLLQKLAALPVMPLWGGSRFQPVDSGEVA
ncbi:MAG: SDR family oxidoreductase, partial [Actinomycetes bacterium]